MSKCLLDAADCVTKVFLENCNSNKILEGEALEKLIEEQYGDIIKNPKNPDVTKLLLEKVEPYKQKGMDFKIFVTFFCEICEYHYKGDIGVKVE